MPVSWVGADPGVLGDICLQTPETAGSGLASGDL